jgi:hypothetical protein
MTRPQDPWYEAAKHFRSGYLRVEGSLGGVYLMATPAKAIVA